MSGTLVDGVSSISKRMYLVCVNCMHFCIVYLQTLQVIDENSEITYNISAEAAGGLVSARDFINVRQWLQLEQDMYLSYGTGCIHADMPVQKKYVRYEAS